MTLPPHSYNPSILKHGKRMLLTFRTHDRDDWRTSLFMAELNEDLSVKKISRIVPPNEIQIHSHEDIRLFSFRGEVWGAWTLSQYPAVQFRSIVMFGQLLEDDAGWKVGNHFAPQYGSNDFKAMEKNWCPHVHAVSLKIKSAPPAETLFCLYSTQEDTQTWLRLDDQGGVAEVMTSMALPWKWGPIHGGCITQYSDDKLIHFFHSRTQNPGRIKHRYHIGAAILDASPPFAMLKISRKPIVYGHEGYCLDDNKRYKPNVCFPSGALKLGASWLLAYGENDDRCIVGRIEQKDLNL